MVEETQNSDNSAEIAPEPAVLPDAPEVETPPLNSPVADSVE